MIGPVRLRTRKYFCEYPRSFSLTMSTSSAEKVVPPPKQSGIRTVLRYTGIPPSWLDKRPKLPSRNWLIFLSATSGVFGLYYYDRRQCRLIREEYVDKVKHLSELPADPFEIPRRVTVYGAKWPGDEDYDQALRHFRRYVKVFLNLESLSMSFLSFL